MEEEAHFPSIPWSYLVWRGLSWEAPRCVHTWVLAPGGDPVPQLSAACMAVWPQLLPHWTAVWNCFKPHVCCLDWCLLPFTWKLRLYVLSSPQVSFRYHCRLYNEWRRTNQRVILLIPKSVSVPSNQQSLLGLHSAKRNSKETIVWCWSDWWVDSLFGVWKFLHWGHALSHPQTLPQARGWKNIQSHVISSPRAKDSARRKQMLSDFRPWMLQSYDIC